VPEPFFSFSPAPDHPGWEDWKLSDPARFNNAAFGRLLVRKDSNSSAIVRMFPEVKHSNMLNAIHGGATLGFIDVALFGAARHFGLNDGAAALTLDLSTQFIGAGLMDKPLDAYVELLRETRRLLFVRGTVKQGEAGNHLVASFSATIRKASVPVPASPKQ